MAQQFNGKLECSECDTIYLSIPKDVSSDTSIHCSTCGAHIGLWHEIEASFTAQGGLNGVFSMSEGQIVRMDATEEQTSSQ